MKLNADVIVMDYDRTVADEKLGFIISNDVKKVLKKIPQKTILATGRVYEDIPDRDAVKIFDALVVENGTILITKGGKKREVLVNEQWFEAKKKIVKVLEEGGIKFKHGEVIISGKREDVPNFKRKLRRHGLLKEVSIDFNKDEYMILPVGWNKGKGAKVAANKFGGRKLVAIGDEINDLSLFEIAEIKVAVGNAVPELKKAADILCDKEDGEGVIEILTSLWRY